MLNATLNSILVLLMEENILPSENHQPVTHH